MAHGRVQGQPPSCPALTGVPVAGIAYLDRPTQAGYFIFPDLSVRHEGRYRLSFNLYEQVKDAKDSDKDSPLPVQDNNVPSTPSKPSAPRAHLHFRLDVKSVPFTVYSAKKFPGLAESTSLSRIVAEQGCRVRIRRDVRMRRRETKANKEFPDYEDNPAYVRPDRYMTPEAYSAPPVERPRSTSNSTVDVPYSYPEPQRRPSIPEYGYHAPPAYPQPPVTPTSGFNNSHLHFGGAQTQYQAPPPPSAQHPPPPPPPAAPYSSPHPGYSHVHSRHGSASSEYDPNAQKYSQPHYPQARPYHAERNDYAKANPSPAPLDPPRTYSAQPYDYRSSDPKAYQSAGQIPASSPRSRTPSNPYPPIAPAQSMASEIEAQHYQQHQHHQSMNGAIPAEPPGKACPYTPEPVLSSKRQHRDVFPSDHQERPLHNGKRPDSTPVRTPGPKVSDMHAALEAGDNPDDGLPSESMVYKRADGRMASKFRGIAQDA